MRINWDRARAIFNFPKPPREVWERQFDYRDADLQRVARTHWESFDFQDLWYYYSDLGFVELQADLFSYLFPICLMDWHQSLQHNQCCTHGDSEFHFGVHQGRAFERMLSARQLQQVCEFFRDSFLDRLDQERGLGPSHSIVSAHRWMSRFNSLGLVIPQIATVWNAWWSLETPGQAVAALQYCSGLMYFDDENPFFGVWTKERPGGVPCLWENDSFIYDTGWLAENIDFLRRTLTAQFVHEHVLKAIERLRGEPEYERAAPLADDLTLCEEIIASRVVELPSRLAAKAGDIGNMNSVTGWVI